jgi:RHS repeat-associated protein
MAMANVEVLGFTSFCPTYRASGIVTKVYGYQPDSTWGSDPVYLKEGTSTYYFQNDHLGTSQKLVSQNGQVVWSARAEAFGITTVEPSSTITNNLRFAGQYYDQETGFYYNWNRYYDPKLGRYVTVDPIGIDGGMNLYLYVEANPTNLIDPTGENPAIAFAVCTAGCALTIAAGNAITGECNNWGDTAVGCAVGCMVGLGTEIPFGKNFRVALFGNRTGHPIGKYPHYHRRGIPGLDGKTPEGQGIGRHRPWESKSSDKNFWDRF